MQRCKKCRKACTVETGNYYMVRDAVWRRAKMGKGIVCLRCLEKALGRKLVQADFTECLLNHLNGHLRVDLLNASPQLFCETLFLAAKIGVTDAMTGAPSRGDHALAALLCEREKYRYEHVRMLHEAYESGQMFMELHGQPTNLKFGVVKS
jgi:hypothetical protein